MPVTPGEVCACDFSLSPPDVVSNRPWSAIPGPAGRQPTVPSGPWTARPACLSVGRRRPATAGTVLGRRQSSIDFQHEARCLAGLPRRPRKGTTDHALRRATPGFPGFRRKVSVCSVGHNCREQVEAYIGSRVPELTTTACRSFISSVDERVYRRR